MAGMLICIALIWEVRSLPRKDQGSVSLAFLGFTNDASGATMAQFTFSNGSLRHIGFGAANVQVRQANGWPQGWMLTNGPCYSVPPGMTQSFTVLLPNVEGAVWRVPIVYARVGTKLDSWIDQAKSVLGLPNVARPWYTNTLEMLGLSNESVQPTEASRSADARNRTPVAAGSRR